MNTVVYASHVVCVRGISEVRDLHCSDHNVSDHVFMARMRVKTTHFIINAIIMVTYSVTEKPDT